VDTVGNLGRDVLGGIDGEGKERVMQVRGDVVSPESGRVADRIRTIGLALAIGVLGLLTAAAPTFAATRVHRVTLALRDFALQPPTLFLRAGERVELVIQNRGAAEYEWSAGRGLIDIPYEKGFRADLLALFKPRVSGQGYDLEQLMTTNLDTKEETEGETVTRLNQEVDVEPGGQVVLDFTVPQDAKGMWQMGCFLPGQYESGMYGAILID
jgi:uncharacterized cupredoxin-like copper-binding protein